MRSNPEFPRIRIRILLLAVFAAFSVGVYLLASRLYYQMGFPLDDSWVHQTYARNLALHGEWSFLPGHTSGGSTAPLWSALLSIGFLIHLSPYGWTYGLGAAGLWAIAVLVEETVRRLVPAYHGQFPWAGSLIVLEWHLVWAAGSGMETILYSLLITAVMVVIFSGKGKPFQLGFLIGLTIWVRPDGITLLGPAVLVLLLARAPWRTRFQSLLRLGLGMGGLVAFYILFNLTVDGHLLPNTFYAKQAEYAILIRLPYLTRLGSELVQPLIGVGALLLPGVGWMMYQACRQRSWGILASMIWFLGYLGMYAWRLPVVYQHGRYVIPAMTVWFLLGAAGVIDLFTRSKVGRRRILIPASQITLGLVLVLFWGRGAYAYAQDVAVIESEMVAAAKWVSGHLPASALIAVHDIGAMGYFGGHDLVDLAGLVSPDVIPFIRNESRLAEYLDERRVDYLVTFPSWYPQLTRGLQRVFSTDAPYAPAMGEDNMMVFRWIAP